MINTLVAVLAIALLAGGVMLFLLGLLAAGPKESLNEQAECLRKDREARAEKQRIRAEKIARRKAKWQSWTSQS